MSAVEIIHKASKPIIGLLDMFWTGPEYMELNENLYKGIIHYYFEDTKFYGTLKKLQPNEDRNNAYWVLFKFVDDPTDFAPVNNFYVQLSLIARKGIEYVPRDAAIVCLTVDEAECLKVLFYSAEKTRWPHLAFDALVNRTHYFNDNRYNRDSELNKGKFVSNTYYTTDANSTPICDVYDYSDIIYTPKKPSLYYVVYSQKDSFDKNLKAAYAADRKNINWKHLYVYYVNYTLINEHIRRYVLQNSVNFRDIIKPDRPQVEEKKQPIKSPLKLPPIKPQAMGKEKPLPEPQAMSVKKPLPELEAMDVEPQLPPIPIRSSETVPMDVDPSIQTSQPAVPAELEYKTFARQMKKRGTRTTKSRQQLQTRFSVTNLLEAVFAPIRTLYLPPFLFVLHSHNTIGLSNEPGDAATGGGPRRRVRCTRLTAETAPGMKLPSLSTAGLKHRMSSVTATGVLFLLSSLNAR
jgi:hypothetical protein